MPINELFNAYTNTVEQGIVDDLVAESITVMGQNFNYIPRNTGNLDKLFFEDTISDFSTFVVIEMLMTTVDAFEGEEEFLSKFDIQIPHQTKLAVAVTTFNTLIGTPAGIAKPREGDLIHWPVTDDIFQISFVDEKIPFFQMGATQMYLLTVEMFTFSHEKFNTGLAVLDNYIASIDELSEDPFAQNVVIETEADAVLDFSEINPFSESEF